MKRSKKSKKKIGKVNPLLYSILYPIFRLIYTRKYHITYDNEIAKSIKGPAIVIATHTSDQDHILSALTLYPVRPTYIVSEHFMRNRSTARLLKLMHVITKKMFTPDVSTIMNIYRAKNENAVIVIFPEGRLSCYGHTLPITEGTAELIKKLGVDLYLWKAEGAYLTFPKWREKGGDRVGKIHSTLKLLLSSDEVKEREAQEIRSLTELAILHDDELAMEGVEYKCSDMSLGVDKILFKCPECLNDGGITAKDGHIRCTCGLDATLDSKYKLHGVRFGRVNEWFEWQQAEMDTEHGSLRSKVRLGCCGEDGYMDSHAGEGEAYIDKDIFRLTGEMHGKKIDFSVSSDRLGAFPITPGEHFDIYHDGRLIYVYPKPDERESVRWVCFLDKLNSERKKETASAVSE